MAKGLITAVKRALHVSGLDATRLELEVTESVLISDTDVALATLNELHALGVRIAMDDFGTGYSSLSYLRRFPFDKLKIDRSFINDIAHDHEAGAIVRAIIQLANTLGIATTAEGVESSDRGISPCAQLPGSTGFSDRPAHAARAAQYSSLQPIQGRCSRLKTR